MQLFRNLVCLALAINFGLAGWEALAHEEQVVLVGRNVAGELVVDSDFDQPVELPVSIYAGISGYATGSIGIHSTILDEPTNDFFQLSTAADFEFVLLAKDPGMEIWTASGFMGTNDTQAIGPSPFDTHPLWNIANGTPGNAYSLTLKIHDLNGIYQDSAPFQLSFTPMQILYRINISQVDSQHVTLFWPTNAAGWELQSATSVTATNWTTVTNLPGIVGTNFSVNIPTTQTNKFFRLHEQ